MLLLEGSIPDGASERGPIVSLGRHQIKDRSETHKRNKKIRFFRFLCRLHYSLTVYTYSGIPITGRRLSNNPQYPVKILAGYRGAHCHMAVYRGGWMANRGF